MTILLYKKLDHEKKEISNFFFKKIVHILEPGINTVRLFLGKFLTIMVVSKPS